MKKRILAMLLAVMATMSLAGCGGAEDVPPPKETQVQETIAQEQVKEEKPAPAPEVESKSEQEETPAVEVPSGINPLTGLPMESEYENDRPVAIMFNNLPRALPQLGISLADIIYEIPAEGAVTRMVGVFQTVDGIGDLGSIRSTRPYYLEVALGHDAVLVHAGGSPDAYDKIPDWGVNNVDGVRGVSSQTAFWRDAGRKKTMGYEHSLLTSGELIKKYIASARYPTEHAESYQYAQSFADEAVMPSAATAETVRLAFYKNKSSIFEYDAAAKRYKVSQVHDKTDAYIDGNTGEQVAATNVLVLETDIRAIAGDTEGRLEVRMTGEGKGTYFCGGKYIPIRWSKADRNSPYVYTLTDGTPLTMARGVSYVCIMDPANSTLKIG